jgi:hypothetical protein
VIPQPPAATGERMRRYKARFGFSGFSDDFTVKVCKPSSQEKKDHYQ